MSFISESSLNTCLKPPSLVLPSLAKHQKEDHLVMNEKKTDHRPELQSNIYYASQLMKLRSELRSPYNHYRNTTKYRSLNDLTSFVDSKRTPFTHRTQSLPNVNFNNIGTDDESEIICTLRPNIADHLSLPFQKQLLSQKEQGLSDDDSPSSDTEQDNNDDDECHSYNRRIIQRRKQQNQPRAFLVSISPSSAAAATVAKSRRKYKQSNIIRKSHVINTFQD